MEELSYGFLKRYIFIKEAIEAIKPRKVLDIGCGTGIFLTVSLAKAFAEVQFFGADSDKKTIAYAQQNNTLPNLRFIEQGRDPKSYDLIIISEVLEHVENPQQFLSAMTESLAENGRILLTVPNGNGPFEVAAFIENGLYYLGVIPFIRFMGKVLKGGKGWPSDPMDTLAVSPHLNFFSFRQIHNLFAQTGLKVIRCRPRTFLCGYGFDALFSTPPLVNWNTKVVDFLPPCFASGWMFLLEKQVPVAGIQFRQNWFARFRRLLNQKRYLETDNKLA